MEPMVFAYPAKLTKEPDGRITVTFRDLPEALTDGADEAEALANAADALSEALMARIADDEPIPRPSPTGRGQVQVAPEPTISAKAALYQIVREKKITAADLSRRLNIDHKEARRMLDPRHKTKLPRLAQALQATGHDLAVTVFDASKRERLLASPSAPKQKGRITPKRTVRVRRKG